MNRFLKTMNITFIMWLMCLMNPYSSYATILFADNFDSQPNWDGRTANVSALTEEYIGKWTTLSYGNPNIGDNNYPAISSSYGHNNTKGFAFFFTSSTGSTQYFNIQSNASFSQSTLYWGYRMKIGFTLGAGQELKLTRFYATTGTSNHVIPDLYNDGGWPFPSGNQIGVWTNSGRLLTGYFPDSNWHTYIWEFKRGTENNDGSIRLWVDGEEVTTWYQSNTTLNFGGEGTEFGRTGYWPNMSENLSGNYAGGNGHVYWDDFIFATTRGEVDNFLGISNNTSVINNSDTTPPIAPSGVSIQIQ